MGEPAADRRLIAVALARACDSTSALASGDWFNGTTEAHRQEASLKRPTGNGQPLPCLQVSCESIRRRSLMRNAIPVKE